MKVYKKQLEYIDAKKSIYCHYVSAHTVPYCAGKFLARFCATELKSLIKVIKFNEIAVEFYKILNLVYENKDEGGISKWPIVEGVLLHIYLNIRY